MTHNPDSRQAAVQALADVLVTASLLDARSQSFPVRVLDALLADPEKAAKVVAALGHVHEWLRTITEAGLVLSVQCACGETPLSMLASLPIVPAEPVSGRAALGGEPESLRNAAKGLRLAVTMLERAGVMPVAVAPIERAMRETEAALSRASEPNDG